MRGSVFASTMFAIRPGCETLIQREIHSKPFQLPCAGVGNLICRSRPRSLQPRASQKIRCASHAAELPTTPPFSAAKYDNITIGVPKESYPGERRVAITPQNVALLLKKGFSRVLIEKGAGVEAQFTDEAYEQAGAKTVGRRDVFSEADILLKVRALSTDGAESEVDAIREGATVISFLYPVQNKPTVESIASRKATAFAMDMVPRISRAQVFDALRYVIFGRMKLAGIDTF
jgi:NAD(P) transhydrogenase